MGSSDSWASKLLRLRSTAQVSRVAHLSLHACCAHYPGGRWRILVDSLFHHPAAFPSSRWGRHPRNSLGTCSGFTHVAACVLARPPFEAFCLRASRWRSPAFPHRAFPRLIATEVHRPNSSGGTFTRWTGAPSRRTATLVAGRRSPSAPSRRREAVMHAPRHTASSWTARRPGRSDLRARRGP